MATVPASLTSVKKLLKNSNITVVGDGLYTSVLHAQFFPELGPPKTAIQVPQVSVLDFGKYNFVVQVDERRAVVSDNSGELSANSQIPAMLQKFLLEAKNVNLSALGVNFTFEVLLDGPLCAFMLARFLQPEPIKRFGSTFKSIGLKVMVDHGDSLLQLTIDPVWGNPTTALVTINFHHENPGQDLVARLVELYGKYVGEVSGLVDKTFL
jgi:hypothetical protein